MGVITTPNFYKALTFDGTSSRTYGVYITGEAVYNAPERAVEMITIPGRNGAFALDQGRFENIEVSYPAGIFAETEADFAEAISDFRNLLCSKRGYVRLTDEYNPDEYRLAVYKSGLEVDPAQLRAGEFDITFECKPQRFLTSGETKTTINSGGTITNPTLFDASPIIEATGYGDIHFNGFDISLQSGDIGTVNLWNETTKNINIRQVTGGSISKSFETGAFNAADTFTFNAAAAFDVFNDFGSVSNTNANVVNQTPLDNNDGSYNIGLYLPCTFTVGTANTITNTSTYTLTNPSNTVKVIMSISYDGNGSITYNVSFTISNMAAAGLYWNFTIGDGSGTSTLTRLGNPTYINCDIGESYKYNGGDLISLNSFIDLGSELPKLAPGANTITFSNTFTKIEIIPNWWKV